MRSGRGGEKRRSVRLYLGKEKNPRARRKGGKTEAYPAKEESR